MNCVCKLEDEVFLLEFEWFVFDSVLFNSCKSNGGNDKGTTFEKSGKLKVYTKNNKSVTEPQTRFLTLVPDYLSLPFLKAGFGFGAIVIL